MSNLAQKEHPYKTAQQTLSKEGWCVLEQVIPISIIEQGRQIVRQAALKNGIDDIWNIKEEVPDFDTWMEIRKTVNYYSGLDRLVEDPELISFVETILDTKVKTFPVNKVRLNLPFTKIAEHPWHQDEATWPDLAGQPSYTFWMPLTDSTPENGLEVCKKNFSGKMIEHNKGKIGSGPFIENEDFLMEEENYRTDLRAGDVVIFNPFIAHRTIRNTAGKIRVSFDFRYAPALT